MRDLAKNEGINFSVRYIRRIVLHWEATGSVNEKSSLNRRLANTKISQNQMNALDRLIYRKRELTAKNAKIRLNLRVSTRTVRKYLNLLGWRRVCTRFCQFVSFKNKIERVIYSKL